MRDSSDAVERGPGAADFGPDDLDRKIVRQSSWVALSYGTRSALSMAAMLALVRLLDPRAFGLVALAWTFLTIVEHLQESGLGAAVVQRRTDVREAAGSALLAGSLSGMLFAGTVVVAAPLVERLMHAPGLAEILRGLAPLLVLRGLAVVPAALLERTLDYKGRARAELAAGVVQPAVAIPLAVAGAGVWSLVFGQLAAACVGTAIIWSVAPWRPNPRDADRHVLRELLRYGRFITGSNIVNLLNDTLDNLTVARLLGTRMLGFYTVTWRLADMPNTVIGNIVGRVLFPVYAAFHADRATVRRVYVQNLQRVALLALPVSAVLVVGAEPLVRGLFGDTWLPVVDPLRLLGLYGAVKSLSAPSGEVFKGIGRPQLGLVFASVHAALVVPMLLLLTPRWGLTGAALALLIVVCASGIPALVTSLRVVDAPLRSAARALAAPVACAFVVAAALLACTPAAVSLPPLGGLALVIVVALTAYAAAATLLARPILRPIVDSFRAKRGSGGRVEPIPRATEP
ncbi:MAG TPA: lipopolysaccharide biosynthesis protein [Gaiellaceae bacterium]|nr:lipopolysaccharide biosynthesis protein [Gaiellaceae bacterium]